MKYIIKQHFAFNGKKFDITTDSETVSTIKATPSKQCKGQFNVKLSNLMSEYLGDNSCIVEPNKNRPRDYLIYSLDDESNEKSLFGQLHYEFCNYGDYLYEIIIGQKLYRVRSSDLKDRRLAIVDFIDYSNEKESTRSTYPQTLYQVVDSFSKSNHKYHVNICEKEWPLGYLAITILLHLHESQRNNS